MYNTCKEEYHLNKPEFITIITVIFGLVDKTEKDIIINFSSITSSLEGVSSADNSL